MARYSDTTQPVRTAGYTGTLDTSANASTDWTDVTGTDITNSLTGTAMPAGLVFTSVAVQNTSSTASAFVKLRARVGAGDATSGEFEVPAGSSIAIECAGLVGGSPSTIAYRKGGASDELIFLFGLETATV
jgi:hypothetical protein